MIQRRQNLYLALMVILSLILSFSSYTIAELPTENLKGFPGADMIHMNYSSNMAYASESKASIGKISSAKTQYMLWCIALFALFAILSFKKLKRQVTFCSFNFAFILFLPVFFYLDYANVSAAYDTSKIELLGTAIIPIALLLFNIVAIRGVVKDYNLLKSMNRIR